jgi:hypothetical protein
MKGSQAGFFSTTDSAVKIGAAKKNRQSGSNRLPATPKPSEGGPFNSASSENKVQNLSFWFQPFRRPRSRSEWISESTGQ